MFLHSVYVLINMCPFPDEVVIDCGRKLRMRQPVRGPGLDRHEAATDFVFALRPWLETLQAIGDAVVSEYGAERRCDDGPDSEFGQGPDRMFP